MEPTCDRSKKYPGRTYRFYNGPVVYPFGYGLSYSRFVHTIANAPTILSVPLHGRHHASANTTFFGKSIRVTHAKCSKLSVNLHIDIKNVGSKDGSHTLLVFSRPPAGHWGPHKQLVAFTNVHLAARTQQRVPIKIHVCKYLSVVDRSIGGQMYNVQHCIVFIRTHVYIYQPRNVMCWEHILCKAFLNSLPATHPPDHLT